ncbi:NAD(P)-dependent oxidoreductase, partial [Stenotrophomonas maltophilia]
FLADASGHSRIRYADYGAAFVAELDAQQSPKQIITAAY